MTAPRDSFRIAIRKFGPFEAAIQERWESFCRATGCRLRLEAQAMDLAELHETLFAKRGLQQGAWDVAFVVTDWLAEANSTGALADLAPGLQTTPSGGARPPGALARTAGELSESGVSEDRPNALGYPSAWPDSLLRHQRFGSAVLGLPYHDGPECLVYRKDLLAAAGAEPPRTWEEFHQLARRLTNPAENRWGTLFAAFPDGHNTVYDFCLQLWTRGGELFDAAGRLQLRTPAAEAALAFYRTMLADASAVHPQCRTFDSVQSGLAFARGEVAMMVNWFGFAALGETLPESKVKGVVGVAPLPAAPGYASASLNVYWLLGAAAGSPHPAEAAAFIRHCASAEGDKQLTLGGGVGCRRSTWGDPDVGRMIPFYPVLETLHAGARELPRLENWEQLAAVIDALVTGAANTSDPIPELLARAQAMADAL
jgi:multiple sugar transport system substrate-binding protein